MKVEDFKKVEHLVKVLGSIKKAHQKLQDEKPSYHETDCGGYGNAVTGYSMHISKFRDGSGSPVDFSGCYIGSEVVDLLSEILIDKFELVKQDLNTLGVDTSAMKIEEEQQ